MLEPRQPVAGRRNDRFRPPHCPWPECPAHGSTGRSYRCIRRGHYTRKRGPQRRVQRFECKSCHRTFCKDAFSTTYYLKRPELLPQVASLLVSGAANRQIARHLGCAPSTATSLGERLGRHADLFLAWSVEQLESVEEPVDLDHFETFVRSQQERLGIGTAAGQRTWFVYALSGAAYVRRKGRSRRKRPLKRRPLPVPSGEVQRSTREIVEFLLTKSPEGLHLVSDDHPAYRGAVRALKRECPGAPPILHEIHANPDRSTGRDREAARRRDSAMFSVDLLHKLLRHSQAHHRRETIAFGRKRANVLGRAALFAVWRNFIKRVTERRPCKTTPGMRIGLTSRAWVWTEVLAERLFPARVAARG